MELGIQRVVNTFERVEARWSLVGAHAIGILTEPRATVDFDFVVDDFKLKSVLLELEKEFDALENGLEILDMGPALRLKALDIDLIRSSTHPLFQKALEHRRQYQDWWTPDPEVLIALKFLSAVSPWRGRTKQMYDVADLRAVVLAVGFEQLDRALMIDLAALVYPGAENKFAELLSKIERGDPIAI